MILLRKKKRSRRKVCSVHKGFKSFDIKNIVFVFLEEIGVSDAGNDTVKGVADTEHQRDTDEGRCQAPVRYSTKNVP